MAKTIKKATVKKAGVKKTVSVAAKKIAIKKSTTSVVKKTAIKKVAKKATAGKSSPKTPALKVVKKAGTKKALPAKSKLKPVLAKSAPVKIAAKKSAKQVSSSPVVKSPAQILADAAIHGILEKKGRNVICLDLRKVSNAVCDFFIICEAESTRQVAAIADSVDFEVKKSTGENPFHTEGWENSLWILLDYVNVVIHVFESETRQFYRLESLWADGEVKEFGVEYA
jgi:ribosome-associated protein